MYSTENKMLMLRSTVWTGQAGLKALTAALKKKENTFIQKNDKIRYKYTTQPTDRHKL